MRVSKKAVQMLDRIATYLSDRTSERTEMDVPPLKDLRAEFLERGINLSRAAQAARQKITDVKPQPVIALPTRSKVSESTTSFRERAAAASVRHEAPPSKVLVEIGRLWINGELCSVYENLQTTGVYIHVVKLDNRSAIILGTRRWPLRFTQIPEHYEIENMTLGQMEEEYLPLHQKRTNPATLE